MPYKSKAQQRFMHARKPKLAKKFDKETKDFSKLPEKAKKSMEEGSSASSWAMFKEDIPKPMNIKGVAGKKKSVETGVAQDDTLMGRLAKRMVARDYIAKQNLGLGREAPKANTADMQEDLDALAKKDQTAAIRVLEDRDAKRKKPVDDKFPAFSEDMVKQASNAATAEDNIPRRMNFSNQVKETANQGIVVLGTPDVEPSKAVKGSNMLDQAKNSRNVLGHSAKTK